MLTKPNNKKLGVFSGTYLSKVTQEGKRVDHSCDNSFLEDFFDSF